MATITTVVLSINHDHAKKTATPVVRTTVGFNSIELQQMKAFPGQWFKMKCEIWSRDTLLNDLSRPWDRTDDRLYTFNEIFYFPDGTPTALESRTFQQVLGEGLLNEDFGTDEVYVIMWLTNLITGVTISKKSNVVSHSF